MLHRQQIRLGVNIDHVATIRNARGGFYPDPVAAAIESVSAGADGITLHLREDRRHIRDEDLTRLMRTIVSPINLEMAVTDEMLAIALQARPHAVCLVPERRHEVTTEGGLDAAGQGDVLKPFVEKLRAAGIRVSLFVDPDETQIEAAAAIGAPVVELHTGQYAAALGVHQTTELARLERAAALTAEYGMECHAGHGLNLENVRSVARISDVKELNIGHYLIGHAIFVGLATAVRTMRQEIDAATAALL